MTAETIIVAVCTIATTALVQAIVSQIFRSAVVDVREANAKLRQELDGLKDGRIKALEDKDARDLQSRALMHTEVENLGKTIAQLSIMLQAPHLTVAGLRAEIDRSIAAGADRVARIETSLAALSAQIGDVMTRIGELRAGKEDKA